MTPYQERVRETILKHLNALEDDLGNFEQTCHGRLGFEGNSWEQLGRELEDVFGKATAFKISELSQLIRILIRDSEYREGKQGTEIGKCRECGIDNKVCLRVERVGKPISEVILTVPKVERFLCCKPCVGEMVREFEKKSPSR